MNILSSEGDKEEPRLLNIPSHFYAIIFDKWNTFDILVTDWFRDICQKLNNLLSPRGSRCSNLPREPHSNPSLESQTYRFSQPLCIGATGGTYRRDMFLALFWTSVKIYTTGCLFQATHTPLGSWLFSAPDSSTCSNITTSLGAWIR